MAEHLIKKSKWPKMKKNQIWRQIYKKNFQMVAILSFVEISAIFDFFPFSVILIFCLRNYKNPKMPENNKKKFKTRNKIKWSPQAIAGQCAIIKKRRKGHQNIIYQKIN